MAPAGAIVVCLFPGQGSQRVGMGRDLAAEFVVARRTLQEAVPPGEGAMAAILGLDADAVAALCAEAAEADVLVPANLNGGGQVVVAGHARAVDRLLPLAAARGARAQLLAVSAPFHCPLM